MIQVKSLKSLNDNSSTLFLSATKKQLGELKLTSNMIAFLTAFEEGETMKKVILGSQVIANFKPSNKSEKHLQIEEFRKFGDQAVKLLNANKSDQVQIVENKQSAELIAAFIEGIILSNYQFLKYFSDAEKRANKLSQINLINSSLASKDIKELINLCEAVYFGRDLVNEPVNFLDAEELAKQAKSLEKLKVKVTTFDKRKIASLKMGGLLAVNKGAIKPPTFSILEYKPTKAKNKKPYIFVGKGVVYDTGGANIKVANFMDGMKSDMGGAAAVIGAIQAIASNKLPIHVIGIVPATENRINGEEYVSGDVIKMHNGKTVEVLNTDAEGRMILADGLSYAAKYNPELVIDLATLTGAAVRAVGSHGIVCMGNADEKTKNKLKEAGNDTYERLVEFPFWDEYGDMIKSNIADIQNLGGPVAGAITAGKFLSHFVDYPWMHFDIAGPALLNKDEPYKPVGGTGAGIRLLYSFIKSVSK